MVQVQEEDFPQVALQTVFDELMDENRRDCIILVRLPEQRAVFTHYLQDILEILFHFICIYAKSRMTKTSMSKCLLH